MGYNITYFVRLKHPDLNAKGPARQTEEDAHRDKECLVGKAVDDQRAMLQRLKQGVPQGGAGTGSVADDRDSPPTAQTPRQMKPRMKLTSSPATPRTEWVCEDCRIPLWHNVACRARTRCNDSLERHTNARSATNAVNVESTYVQIFM